MKHALTLTTLCSLGITALHAVASDTFIVEDGRPKAEIIIAQQPRRTTRLAAHELQVYVERISGAKLAIATEPSGKVPVRSAAARTRTS